MTLDLIAGHLDAQEFAPFGQVIAVPDCSGTPINDGTAMRFDLGTLDVAEAGGLPSLSVFRVLPAALPLRLSTMERHPMSSQAFVPFSGGRFLIAVAAAGSPPEPEDIHAFITNGRQGVNYGRGVWHSPVMALSSVTEFAVFDRQGLGDNCDFHRLAAPLSIAVSP